MWKLRLTTAAKQDISDTAKYIAQTSGSAAAGRRFALEIKTACERLASRGPKMGRPRPEFGAELRSFVEGNYYIFLRYVDDTLEIVNVIERHRDLDSRFDR